MSYAQSFFPFSVTFKLTIVYGKSKLGMNMMTKSGSDWDMKQTDRDIKNCTKWRNPRGIRWCCGSNGKNLFLPSLSRESPTCFKQPMNLLHWNKLSFFFKENTAPNQQEDKFDLYRYTARSHTSTWNGWYFRIFSWYLNISPMLTSSLTSTGGWHNLWPPRPSWKLSSSPIANTASFTMIIWLTQLLSLLIHFNRRHIREPKEKILALCVKHQINLELGAISVLTILCIF